MLYFQVNSEPLSLCAGHDKPVSSVSWSLNRQCWLSASEDQTLRIWTHGSPEPAIIMVNVSWIHYNHSCILLICIVYIHSLSFHPNLNHHAWRQALINFSSIIILTQTQVPTLKKKWSMNQPSDITLKKCPHTEGPKLKSGLKKKRTTYTQFYSLSLLQRRLWLWEG